MKKRINGAWTSDKYSIYERNAPTFENETSLAIYSDGTPIDSYSFEGNCYQASTPTPTNPVEVEEFGDLITSGDNAGLYDVPITSAGQTVHLILPEPLRKIGNYADSVDSEGVVTRKIKKSTINDLNMTWVNFTINNTTCFRTDSAIDKLAGDGVATMLCDSYKVVSLRTQLTENFEISPYNNTNSSIICVRDERYTTATDWLAANGNVELYYVLKTAVTESYSKNLFTPATAQTITLNGVTCTSDGAGRYSFSGSSTANITFEFDLIDEFTIPISVGQGGGGTFSFFNNFFIVGGHFRLELYYNDTLVENWTYTDENRKTNSYVAMGGKKVNKIKFTISANKSFSEGSLTSPMFTDNGQYPTVFEPHTPPTIPTASGNSTITIGTSLAPSKVELDMGKMFCPHTEKVRVNGAWT